MSVMKWRAVCSEPGDVGEESHVRQPVPTDWHFQGLISHLQNGLINFPLRHHLTATSSHDSKPPTSPHPYTGVGLRESSVAAAKEHHPTWCKCLPAALLPCMPQRVTAISPIICFHNELRSKKRLLHHAHNFLQRVFKQNQSWKESTTHFHQFISASAS